MSRRLVLWLLGLYQRHVSPRLPADTCRFTPSCSEYTRQAVVRFGAGHGLLLGLERVARCGPWHPGGHDPIPGDELTTLTQEAS